MDKIIVSVSLFNNDEEVIEYGRQLANQSYADYIVYLVTANAANNYPSLERSLKQLRIESHIFNPMTNLGYLNGCLYGFRQYKNYDEKDYFVISNTDLSIIGKNAFCRIADIMTDSMVWCLGPSIKKSTGEFQNPFLEERPSAKRIQMWRRIQGNSFLLRFYTFLSQMKQKLKGTRSRNESQNVYAVHGSFFVMNFKCIQELLALRNGIFMYGEEILLAEVVRENSGLVRYSPDVEIIHNENSTTGLTNSRVKAAWYRQSFDYLQKTFFDF